MDLIIITSNRSEVMHVAFADDLAGAGRLRGIRIWWDQVKSVGPKLGYYPNASKSWLIVKEQELEQAREIFQNIKINITTEGRKYLGSFIGDENGKSKYINDLVQEWCDQLDVLCKIALSEPHAAYSAFVSGFRHKITYFMRTIPGISRKLQKLDDLIDEKFLPNISDGHICTKNERLLISLPVKLGGLGIPVFSDMAEDEYRNSREATKELRGKIIQQDKTSAIDLSEVQRQKRLIAKSREQKHDDLLQHLRQEMTKEQLRANELNTMKGASSWLTTLPLKSENFILNKREFRDAISLRYRWQLKYLPSICVCGKKFNVDHAMSCMKGGFIHQRHKDICELSATLLKDVCNDVEIEPPLQPLTGEYLQNSANTSEEARLDVSARGFWQRGQCAFFDVRIFNPFAQTYLKQKSEATFVTNEKQKKRAYNQRVIEIEHGSFSPLVFTPYGGCGREAERFISELSIKLSEKKDIENSIMKHWLRTKISFYLIRSAVLCIRGSRTLRRGIKADLMDIEISDAIGRIET